MASIMQALNADLSGVIQRVRRSVVQVVGSAGGAGAGTVWHRDGLILTNAHVVRDGHFRVALQDGRTLPAEIIARDDERDLAALSIPADDLPVIEAGSARGLLPGQWVFAVGHPWGVANAASGGVVIGLGKPLAQLPGLHTDWVTVDLKLRPGNSGGPLVDVQGRIIGVNTIMTGILGGAAVSVEAARQFLRPFLGGAAAPAESYV